jgi:hypothetical protein
MPIQESEFYDELLPHIYSGDHTGASWDATDSHRLAVVCMVLASGTFHDMTNPDFVVDSRYWFHLGKAALSLHDALEYPSIPGIQALVRMHAHTTLGNLVFASFSFAIICHLPA